MVHARLRPRHGHREQEHRQQLRGIEGPREPKAVLEQQRRHVVQVRAARDGVGGQGRRRHQRCGRRRRKYGRHPVGCGGWLFL